MILQHKKFKNAVHLREYVLSVGAYSCSLYHLNHFANSLQGHAKRQS